MSLSCTIASLSLLVLLLSCGPSGLSDKALEDILFRRYGRAFTVEKNDYVLGINKYQFYARTVSEPEIGFSGEYEKGGKVEDEYPFMLHDYQAQKDLAPLLGKHYKRYASMVSVSSYYEHGEGGKAPASFSELLAGDAQNTSITVWLYLFDTVTQANKSEVLSGVMAAIDHYQQWPLKRCSFLVKFWDKRFLEGRDFESLHFGFDHYTDEYVNSLSVEDEYVRQGLEFRFSTPLKHPISEDDLYAAIGPYDQGNGFEMKFFE